MSNVMLMLDRRICGRGKHLLRSAVRDGFVVVPDGPDIAALSPVRLSGFVQAVGKDRYEPTPAGRAYLERLARAD